MDMSELLKKKSSGPAMDPKEKSAKMGVLKDIRDMAMGSMGDEIKGMKKVSVAAPDQAGLEEGLDTAKGIVGGTEDNGSLHEHPKASNFLTQQIDHEAEEGDLSAEDIDALIAELQAKKQELEQNKQPE